LHDALDGLVDVFGRDRTLVQRALEAVADALGVEIRARAVLLDDLRQPYWRFVGRKAFLAGNAPAAADRVAGRRRIDDLRTALPRTDTSSVD
jgi:hypothetical protein